jgi:hypothetical protein
MLRILFFIYFSFLFIGCKLEDESKIKLELPQLLTVLTPEEYFIFFYDREVDQDLSPNCGVASPSVGVATGPVQGGVGTPQPVSGGTTGQSRFTIVSQLFIKRTGESMAMRFLFDPNQSQGSIDQQQGFTMTGGIFNNTVSGRQGIVEWGLGNAGIGYIDESSNTTQTLSFFNLKLKLTGTFQRGETTTTTTPNECFTQDNVNCTTVATGTKCFTQDNQKCLVISSGGTTVTIQGDLRCNSSNVIPGT